MDQRSRELLERYFPDGNLSILLRVAFDRGYGPTLMPLVEKIFLSGEFSLPPVITEAVQVLAHSTCQNKYCAVFHAAGLVALGFSLAEVQALVERQTLPDHFPERERWEPTLRRVTTQFHTPELSGALFAQLALHHQAKELEDLGALLAFCSLDRFVLEFHSTEIDVTQESMVFDRVGCARELVQYFTEERGNPVAIFMLCCRCKDVLTSAGWTPIEGALAEIPGDARFSHGYCSACVEVQLSALGN